MESVFFRDFGPTRLLVLDSRAGRVLDEDRREMLSEEEWGGSRNVSPAIFDHLLIATTLPLSRSAAAVARLLARSAGVWPAAVRWEFAGEPTFDNQVATLHLTGRGAHLTIEQARPEGWASPQLHQTLSRTIA